MHCYTVLGTGYTVHADSVQQASHKFSQCRPKKLQRAKFQFFRQVHDCTGGSDCTHRTGKGPAKLLGAAKSLGTAYPQAYQKLPATTRRRQESMMQRQHLND